MASTKVGKVVRFESEIERFRAEGNWARLLDQTKQNSTKNLIPEHFLKFIQVECHFERFLLEHLPSDLNAPDNLKELSSFEKEFNDLLSNISKPELTHELRLLLAKIKFLKGYYQDALDAFNLVDLDRISLTDITLRKLKIVGESFALKGLCMEKLLPTLSNDTTESIIKCFEISGDISLYQLQELSRNMCQNAGQYPSVVKDVGVHEGENIGLSPFVEMAIRCSPYMHIRNGNLDKGIFRLRDLLSAVEKRGLTGLRQALSRKLAEVLMRGVCRASYPKLTFNTKYGGVVHFQKYSGENLFYPKDESEEILLLLMISESIASREVLLNHSPDLVEAHQCTLNNAIIVYDLLTIILARYSQFSMLSETFEKATKFSFDEFHIWYQFALSLICSQKYVRAYLVLKECMKLKNSDPTIYMLTAKLCFEQLNMISEGIEYAKQVTEMSNNHPLLARSNLFVAIGYNKLADNIKLISEKHKYHALALEALKKAANLDANDHLIHYHLAYQLALLRKIPPAMEHVKLALHIQYDHLQSLHLLALLLTADKNYMEALQLIHTTISLHTHDLGLLFTKFKIEIEIGNYSNGSLVTCKDMLILWRDLFSETDEGKNRINQFLNKLSIERKITMPNHDYPMEDKESGSVMMDSLSARRVEQALSDVASSINGTADPTLPVQESQLVQMKIWLCLAEVFIKMRKWESANDCLMEASSICSVSYQIAYMKGTFHYYKENLEKAQTYFENSISINPSHIKSLHSLGMVLYKIGNYRLAERMVRNALSHDPASSQAWNLLGDILTCTEDHQLASECYQTSLELEKTSPVVPFSVVQQFYI